MGPLNQVLALPGASVNAKMSDKAVAFNSTTNSDSPSIIGPSGSILLGLYGTAGMMVFPKGSTSYIASMAAVGTGALTYYYNYFG